MLHKLFWLALAGAVGTLARYGLAELIQRVFGASFPWGTLAVNLLGCFMAGLFWTLAELKIQMSGETRTILLIGFLGAFTTFSAFILETGELMRDAEWLQAAGNFALQNVAGIVALFSGTAAGRFL